MRDWESQLILVGFSEKEIKAMRKLLARSGKKGGNKKVPKGLALLSPERRREIASMGGRARHAN